eukprot:scaffold5840_cov121-Skeletonema_marinoi.AAC.1
MDMESSEFCFVYHAKDAGRIYQHFANQDNSEENSNKVLLIDPLQPWQDILKILQTCKRVAASSLHGISLADSMGIPSLWFQFARGKYSSYSEGYFKYQDYFLSIGREGANKMAPIVDTNQVFDISRYSAPLPTQDREAIANRLLASFPKEGVLIGGLLKKLEGGAMSTKPRIITWMAIEIIEKASGMIYAFPEPECS